MRLNYCQKGGGALLFRLALPLMVDDDGQTEINIPYRVTL
jgi:hypothetical protein